MKETWPRLLFALARGFREDEWIAWKRADTAAQAKHIRGDASKYVHEQVETAMLSGKLAYHIEQKAKGSA